MTCHEARQFVNGYVDGELDLVRSVELEQHVADCGSCHRQLRAVAALKQAVRTAAPAYGAPPELADRIAAAVGGAPRQVLLARPTWKPLTWAAAATVVAAAIVLAAISVWLRQPTAASVLVEELAASHIRSLQANHLLDVISTDRHTVKPWFAGKLDFSPQVVDLKSTGFALVGGRLDYIDNRPVAALVYTHGKHFINLFQWPASEAREGLLNTTYRGYHLVDWSEGSMSYWAVSDMDASELDQLAQQLQAAYSR